MESNYIHDVMTKTYRSFLRLWNDRHKQDVCMMYSALHFNKLCAYLKALESNLSLSFLMENSICYFDLYTIFVKRIIHKLMCSNALEPK